MVSALLEAPKLQTPGQNMPYMVVLLIYRGVHIFHSYTIDINVSENILFIYPSSRVWQQQWSKRTFSTFFFEHDYGYRFMA